MPAAFYLQLFCCAVVKREPECTFVRCQYRLISFAAAVERFLERTEVLRSLHDSQRRKCSMKIALIDNYDSFTRNLYNLIYTVSGERPRVLRNDDMSYTAFRKLRMDCTVISPGPGHPACGADFGMCSDVLLHSRTPVLGVCLGHQGIGVAFGGEVSRAPQPVHGLIAQISHNGKDLFEGIPQGVRMVRYHSLIVNSPLPSTLQKTAWTADGLIMGLRHRKRNLFGVQFHPESICSEYGETLMKNFLRTARQ